MKHYGSHRPCWIDSLCVDQGSHGEKTSQVRQMGPIYSGAYEVAACVGDLALEDKNFLEHLESWEGDPKPIESISDAWVASMASFSRRSYFSRQWTIQECVLGQRLEVFVGFEHFPWLSLRPYLQFIGGFFTLQHFDTDFGLDHNWWKSCERLHSLDRDIENYVDSGDGRLPLDLAETILRYRDRECSKPEDKLYGILSLVPYAIRGRIGLDYSKSLFTILLDFVGAYRKLKVESNELDGRLFQRPPPGPYLGWGVYDDALWRDPKTIKDSPNEPRGKLFHVIKSIGVILQSFIEAPGFLAELRGSLSSKSVKANAVGNTMTSSIHWSERGLIDLNGGAHYHWVTVNASDIHDAQDVTFRTENIQNVQDLFSAPWNRSRSSQMREVLSLPCGHDIDANAEGAKRIRSSTAQKITCCYTSEHNRHGEPTYLHYTVAENVREGDFILSSEAFDDNRRRCGIHIVCRASQETANRFEIIGFALRPELVYDVYDAGPSPKITLRPETLLALALIKTREDDYDFPLSVSIPGSFVDTSQNNNGRSTLEEDSIVAVE